MSARPARFERVAVLGLGLLGGSVALAARRRGAARRVAGATRSREARAVALECGIADEVGEPAEAVRGADLVVLATPVHAMADSVRGIAAHLAEGALVTDVGSVKAPLADLLPGLLPPHATYVGAHPMAGSHERGIEHARADLFEGAPCVVLDASDRAARERVCGFWEALGARVLVRAPALHDAEVAWMSHLPHALAFAYASALATAPADAGAVAGAGFRDFTRIARSDPDLWADILTANRKALAAPLDAAARALAELARGVEAGDADAVFRQLSAAREALSTASREGHGPQGTKDEPRAPASQRGRAGEASSTA